MRGVMKGYEDEFNARKLQLKKQKELEEAEERKKFVDVGALEKAEREKEQAKKKNLLREQLDNLDLLNRKKEYENQKEKNDDKNLIKNLKDPFGKQYLSFRDNLAKKNNRIFGNAQKYNNLLGTPVDPSIFNAKNDDEFNKLYAEAQARERNKIDPTELNQALKNLDEYNKGLKKQKENNNINNSSENKKNGTYVNSKNNKSSKIITTELNFDNSINNNLRMTFITPLSRSMNSKKFEKYNGTSDLVLNNSSKKLNHKNLDNSNNNSNNNSIISKNLFPKLFFESNENSETVRLKKNFKLNLNLNNDSINNQRNNELISEYNLYHSKNDKFIFL